MLCLVSCPAQASRRMSQGSTPTGSPEQTARRQFEVMIVTRGRTLTTSVGCCACVASGPRFPCTTTLPADSPRSETLTMEEAPIHPQMSTHQFSILLFQGEVIKDLSIFG